MATAKPLKELIQPYPYLAKALNHRWCERQEPDALGDSSHTLARWLRSPTANGLLTALDEALQLLDASPRIKQWRKSLADDREGIRGALFEIFLAAWFHKQGYSVGAPSKDADFTLPLRGGHSARLELTTIQRQTNLGMLTERLQAVGAGLNLAGHLSYEPSKLRNLTATNVDRIVEAEIEALTSPISEGARTRLEERSPQFGINLSWTPSHTPNIYSRSSAEWVDANQDWLPVLNTIDKKSAQIKRSASQGEAVYLVIDISDAPTGLFILLDLFERHLVSFPWTLPPDNVPTAPSELKCLILCSLNFDRIDRPDKSWIICNPLSSIAEPAGWSDFLRECWPGIRS